MLGLAYFQASNIDDLRDRRFFPDDRGVDLGDFRADLVVESIVLVELKAVRMLESAHEKQVLNYLKATNIEVGLLCNFGPRPQVRRLVLENERKLARGTSA